MMLRQAEEQLKKQFDLPRPVSDVQAYKDQIYDLKEENRAQACHVAQLQTQIEVQKIAEKHQKEQMQVKDQMIAMQEDMLN